MDLAVFEPDLHELSLDLEVLLQLQAELPDRSPRRMRILQALDDAMDALDLQQLAEIGRRRPGRAGPRPEQSGRGQRPSDRRGRAFAHRLGLALADPRDHPQGGPDDGVDDRADRRTSGVRLRDVQRPAVRLDQGAPTRGLRAGQGGGRRRTVRPARRDVGGERHDDADRRGAGPAVHLRSAVLPRRVRPRMRRGLAARQLRLLTGPAAADPSSRLRLVLHPEDLLEPGQRLPAPHLLVGGHRRVTGVQPLPADGHLQLRAVRRRGGAGQSTVPGEPARRPFAGPGRLGRRRWRDHPGDGRPGPATGRSRGQSAGPLGASGRLLRHGQGRVAERAGLGRRALSRAAPGHPDQSAPDQAGQPAQRAAADRGRVVEHRTPRSGPGSTTPTTNSTGCGGNCC